MAFKMKGFKAHNMYKTERAETEAEHNALEKKGFDHNPYKMLSPFSKKKCDCWKGYERVPGTKPCTKKSCRKKR
jgi:hypothetical protein|tara:strand:+ start:100 stop:321 length:222 start_codon:yes stop_codon:yes gene_type:complete